MIIELESLNKLPRKKYKLFVFKEAPEKFNDDKILVYKFKNFYFLETKNEEEEDVSFQASS